MCILKKKRKKKHCQLCCQTCSWNSFRWIFARGCRDLTPGSSTHRCQTGRVERVKWQKTKDGRVEFNIIQLARRSGNAQSRAQSQCLDLKAFSPRSCQVSALSSRKPTLIQRKAPPRCLSIFGFPPPPASSRL